MNPGRLALRVERLARRIGGVHVRRLLDEIEQRTDWPTKRERADIAKELTVVANDEVDGG